jgi:hypothetical protein
MSCFGIGAPTTPNKSINYAPSAPEATDESAWEAPIQVHTSSSTAFSLPADLAARAAFLARLHHLEGVEEWLGRIIRERIELEENAFAEAKRELSPRSGAQPNH